MKACAEDNVLGQHKFYRVILYEEWLLPEKDYPDSCPPAKPNAYQLRKADTDSETGQRTGLSVLRLPGRPSKHFLVEREVLNPVYGFDVLNQECITSLGLHIAPDPKDSSGIHYFIEGLPDPYGPAVTDEESRKGIARQAKDAAMRLLTCAHPDWRGDALDEYPLF